MLKDTQVNREKCLAAAKDPALLATDLADYLVCKGVAFRQAHHVVGSLVALAEQRGKPLNRLTLAEMQSVEKRFEADALNLFELKQALARREVVGAPGTSQVRKQLARWKGLLK
jgi:argininosuccinate lyase